MAYQANPGMSVAAGNRNAKNISMGPDGREWSHGLCDCCGDPGTCILAWCIPSLVYGQLKQRYDHLNTKGYPDPERGGFCSGDCWIHLGLTACCGAGWILQMGTRAAIRGRYSIKGGTCGDCCTALCCTPCELVQETRELELEEETYQGKQG